MSAALKDGVDRAGADLPAEPCPTCWNTSPEAGAAVGCPACRDRVAEPEAECEARDFERWGV